MARVRKVIIALYVAAHLVFVAVALALLRDAGPVRGAIGAVLVIAVAGASLLWLRRGYFRRMQPTWDEEFPDAARARVTPGGEFVWEPRGAPRSAVRHGIVHRWWDVEHAPRVGASLSFDIPDEVPPEVLLAATRKGLAATKRALPGRGKVRAKAAGRDEPGPTSLVRVRLEVQGHGADETWSRAASEAFAHAFLRALGREDFAATRKTM